MEATYIQSLLESAFPGAHISVQGDDGHHFEAIIHAPQFSNKSRVQQQQMVYQVLNQYIISGELHAISLKTDALTIN